MSDHQGRTAIAQCACGGAALEAVGKPILSAACYCASCQAGGRRIEELPGASPVLDADGGTPFLLYRKDRVRCVRGGEALREMRLTPSSPTRRVVATCCNSAIFLEFADGHWLSMYAARFAPDDRPPLEMRTMAKDRRAGVEFHDGVTTSATHSLGFMWRLMTAWAAMGFRVPPITYVRGGSDAEGR